MKAYRLKEIAAILDGIITGSGEIEVVGMAEMQYAKDNELSLIARREYFENYSESKAAAFIIPMDYDIRDRPCIKIPDTGKALISLLNLFFPEEKREEFIHETAVFGDNIKLGQDINIGANVVIEDECIIGDGAVLYPGSYIGRKVAIGNNTVIFPNVTIYKDVTIGSNVRIHSGTVIGSDGFGYIVGEDLKRVKIPQVGSIIIEDDVEIGSNVSIDRATLGKTIIRQGTKLDNLIQVAHNVSVGRNTVMAAQTGISGSCIIGDSVTIAGQVGFKDHVTIENNTVIGAQSGIAGNLKTGIYMGSPAIDHKLWKRVQVALQKLPEILRKVNILEKSISTQVDK